jgi:hypothetical protein
MFGLSVCGQELKGCFLCTASGEIYFFVAMISRGAWSLEDQLRYLIWYEWKTSKRKEKEREREREREGERERDDRKALLVQTKESIFFTSPGKCCEGLRECFCC